MSYIYQYVNNTSLIVCNKVQEEYIQSFDAIKPIVTQICKFYIV